MPERSVIVNTSPLLYLHQVGQLSLLKCLYGTIQTPSAVAQELETGRLRGIDVPHLSETDWIQGDFPQREYQLSWANEDIRLRQQWMSF